MKWYKHVIIIVVLVTLTFLLYNKGLGAVPFILAAIYLIVICLKELQYLKKSKRM